MIKIIEVAVDHLKFRSLSALGEIEVIDQIYYI